MPLRENGEKREPCTDPIEEKTAAKTGRCCNCSPRVSKSSRHSSGWLSQGLSVLSGCIWPCSQVRPVLLIRKTRTVPGTHQSPLLIYGVCTVRYTKDLSRKRTSKNSASISGPLLPCRLLLSQALVAVIIIDLGVWRDCRIMDS